MTEQSCYSVEKYKNFRKRIEENVCQTYCCWFETSKDEVHNNKIMEDR